MARQIIEDLWGEGPVNPPLNGFIEFSLFCMKTVRTRSDEDAIDLICDYVETMLRERRTESGPMDGICERGQLPARTPEHYLESDRKKVTELVSILRLKVNEQKCADP